MTLKIKTLLLTFIAFCSLQTVFGQEQELLPRPSVPIVIDEMAQFPGGHSALNKFLAENLIYPERAVKDDISGKVYLKYLVLKDGTIENITVAKGIPGCEECSEEGIRLVKVMPKWIPGKHKGVAVDSHFTLLVVFKLQ